MSVSIIQIPDDPHRLAHWLEEVITGPQLARVIRELCLLQDRQPLFPPVKPLAEVLGAESTVVLQRGLQALSLHQIRELTAEPELLLELQELLLEEGGDYWNQRWQNKGEKHHAADMVKPASRSRLPLLIGGGIASVAAVLILMFAIGNWNSHSAAVAWGWHAPNLLSSQQLPSEHLRALAAAGEEWFEKSPANSTELAERIRDMKSGCERLIAARHPQLATEDERWLKEKCQLWLEKFNTQLTSIKADSSVATVQKEMDAIVSKLVDTLRQKAKELET